MRLGKTDFISFAAGFTAILLAFLLSAPSLAHAAVNDRIAGAIDNTQASVVKNNVHPLAAARFDHGKVRDSLPLPRITMVFRPTSSQQASLNALLAQLQNPSSPNYHHWLSPEQFAAQFGLSQNDLNKTVAWLQGQGFTVDRVARSHRWVVFSGTAGLVQSAFHTEIHSYVVNGATRYANSTDPLVPSAMASVVLGFRGLNNFRMAPRSVIRQVTSPRFTSSISGNHYLAPSDFATIYDLTGLYNSGLTGAGQKIAVMGQTDITLSDIDAFRSASGLPANDPTVVLIPGSADPGLSTTDITEADLDVEWSGATAPNATIYYVNSTDAFDSLQYAIDQALAPIAVITYGSCEQQWDPGSLETLENEAQQANAEGITIVAPSGDNGAADCDESTNTNTVVTSATQGLAVDAPASLPEVTGIGGTEFSDSSGNYWNTTNSNSSGSAISYIPETAWNDTNSTNGLSASGGGPSADFGKPAWQTGSGVPNDNMRDVPDIALDASPGHDGYLICSQGSCVSGYRDSSQNLNVVGGTSAGAPTFAGILALVNQQTNSAQGNINYVLYSMAASDPAAFHDITQGNNTVPCTAGTTGCPSSGSFGFNAGPGYDLVTGLGSIDAGTLVADWASVASAAKAGGDFQLFITPGSLTVASGSSGTVGVSLTAVNGFTGTVNFTCATPSTLAATCSVSPTSVSPTSAVPHGSAVLTVTSTAAANAEIVFPGRFGGWGGWPALMLILVLLGSLAFYVSREKHSTFRSYSPYKTYSSYRFRNSGWMWRGVLAGALFLCIAAFGTSCGGGSASPSPASSTQPAATPTPVTANVVVTATSGSISHNVQVAVTVN
ncbi:MAG TPA: S53 family peptidase [Terriglobia bacterium]|nr:S53 family peptidase [Terriglobia bacterium]